MQGGRAIDWWLLTAPLGERIARARIRYSHHALVRVRDAGDEGWGAAPLYARVPHQVRALRPALAALAAELDQSRPAEARRCCAEALGHAPDLLNALDGALWELEALRAGRTVAALLGAEGASVPITEQLFADAAAQPGRIWPSLDARGIRRLKIKATGSVDADLAVLARIRRVAGPAVRIRVDANRGYDPADAVRLAPGLRRLGIEEWEEPVEADFAAIARLRRRTGLRVILDESVRSPAELERALDAGAVDVLNLKLSRIGGITAALDYRRRCAAAGVEVLLGCNEDLGPGMAAVLHAAAAWRPFETEGVGWQRLGLDIASPSPAVAAGAVELGAGPGWGLELEPRVLARGGAAGRTLPQLVHVSDWSRSFAALSLARQQRQRLDNAGLRAGLHARRSLRRRPQRREAMPG